MGGQLIGAGVDVAVGVNVDVGVGHGPAHGVGVAADTETEAAARPMEIGTFDGVVSSVLVRLRLLVPGPIDWKATTKG